jgi:beta-glucosidase
MTSFNDIDGVPASGNKWLLTNVLRNQWGFKGFIVSDYTLKPAYAVATGATVLMK